MHAETLWKVPTDHPAFAGHFPDHPIVPGVLLLDHVLVLAEQHWGRPVRGWTVTQAKFLSPSGPGDALAIELHQSPRGGLAFTIRCGGRDVAVGSLAPLVA